MKCPKCETEMVGIPVCNNDIASHDECKNCGYTQIQSVKFYVKPSISLSKA